jgi:hypothetical protein
MLLPLSSSQVFLAILIDWDRRRTAAAAQLRRLHPELALRQLSCQPRNLQGGRKPK